MYLSNCSMVTPFSRVVSPDLMLFTKSSRDSCVYFLLIFDTLFEVSSTVSDLCTQVASALVFADAPISTIT